MFKQFKNMLSGEIRSDVILYRDEDNVVWTVPAGHRKWVRIYEPWLAAGNTPLGPDDPWPELTSDESPLTT